MMNINTLEKTRSRNFKSKTPTGNRLKGFLLKEILETFDRIKDEQDWRRPIMHTFPKSVVQEASFPLLVAKCELAISYYHGGRSVWKNNAGGSITLISRGFQLKY